MSRRDKEPTHDYVGRRPCGCVMALAADLGDRYTADAVRDMIIHGGTVERVTREELRIIMDEPTFMSCPHGQMRMALD